MPFDEPVAFERAERLREHFFRDAAYLIAQLGVALFTLRERTQHERAPAAEDVVENFSRETMWAVGVSAGTLF
jgi:hypothetical protein